MLEFYAYPFMATMADLGRAIRALEGSRYPMLEVRSTLEHLKRDLPGLPLSPIVLEMFDRLQEMVINEKATPEGIKLLLFEFESSLHANLREHSYFLVPASKRAFYDSAVMPFGVAVNDMLDGDANTDISEASKCMAFDRFTAAVFHLMRAAEQALRMMARDLNVPDVDVKEWQELLQHVKNALNALRNQPRVTPNRARDMEYYAHALESLDLFKDAWRNPVSHSRAHYSEARAIEVWVGVGAFMQRLASRTVP